MLKKLLTGVLALTLVANVTAKDVKTEETKEVVTEVVNFINTAKLAGASDEQIVKAFEAALANTDEAGLSSLKIDLKDRKQQIILGGVALTAVAMAYGAYYKRGAEGWRKYVPFGMYIPVKTSQNNNGDNQNAQ